jgi:hypothetical protein
MINEVAKDNIALLIEMGYEIYSKPYGNWLSGVLTQKSTAQEACQRVGMLPSGWPISALKFRMAGRIVLNPLSKNRSRLALMLLH